MWTKELQFSSDEYVKQDKLESKPDLNYTKESFKNNGIYSTYPTQIFHHQTSNDVSEIADIEDVLIQVRPDAANKAHFKFCFT